MMRVAEWKAEPTQGDDAERVTAVIGIKIIRKRQRRKRAQTSAPGDIGETSGAAAAANEEEGNE